MRDCRLANGRLNNACALTLTPTELESLSSLEEPGERREGLSSQHISASRAPPRTASLQSGPRRMDFWVTV